VTRISSAASVSVFGKYVGSRFIDAFAAPSCADDAVCRMLPDRYRASTSALADPTKIAVVVRDDLAFIVSSSLTYPECETGPATPSSPRVSTNKLYVIATAYLARG
jgi:hypothetical protein